MSARIVLRDAAAEPLLEALVYESEHVGEPVATIVIDEARAGHLAEQLVQYLARRAWARSRGET